MRILGIPLGWILHFCYSLVQNYGLALVMFKIGRASCRERV